MIRNILVTGGTGFFGRHLINHLASLSNNITLLTRRDTSLPDDIDSSINLICVDDEINLSHLKNTDCVIHLATCYGRNGETKEQIYETNFKFGIKLLEMAKKIQSKYFINFDTSLPDQINHYSSSKAAFRSTCKKYAGDSLKIVNLKIESIYGPNKSGKDFSNLLIQTCMNNEKSINLSGCDQIRDFIFYKDLIHCIELILDNLENFPNYKILQVGSGKGVTLKRFAELVKALTKSRTELLYGKIPYKNNEVMKSIASIKTLEKIGWVPKTNLENGLKEIIFGESNGRIS